MTAASWPPPGIGYHSPGFPQTGLEGVREWNEFQEPEPHCKAAWGV